MCKRDEADIAQLVERSETAQGDVGSNPNYPRNLGGNNARVHSVRTENTFPFRSTLLCDL